MTRSGFTLMELLIVMTILGIISIISIGLVRNATPQARDARRKADLDHVQKALEVYYADHEVYPTANEVVFGGAFTEGGKTYMARVPQDPQNPNNQANMNTYMYIVDGARQTYALYSCLEVRDTAPTYALNCCSGSCYFGLSSSDTTPEEMAP